MRTLYIKSILFLALTICIHAYGQENQSSRKLDIPTSKDEIHLLDSTINLYQAGDFFISGQPDDSIIDALKSKGLGVIITVRTPEEMNDIKEKGFDEEEVANSLDIAYTNIPIGGSFGFTHSSIQEINNAILSNEGKVMIHCGSAGRATNAWMAWLINYYNIPINDAISLGRQMQLRFYLEDLLGYELIFNKK